jgi:hypothetical protein
MGRARWVWSFLDDPGAKFSVENGEMHVGMARAPSGTMSRGKGSARQGGPFPTHSFHRGGGAERPGAVKGAPLGRRGESETLTRTALKPARREGKE